MPTNKQLELKAINAYIITLLSRPLYKGAIDLATLKAIAINRTLIKQRYIKC